MLLETIENRYPNKCREFYESVFNICVLYCIRHYNAFEFQNRMKVVFSMYDMREESRMFRYNLTENSYFSLNLKMFIFEYADHLLSPQKNRAKVQACIKKFSIHRADFVLFQKFYTNKKYRRITKSVFREYKGQPIPSPHEVRTQFCTMHDALIKHCNGLAYRKLRFITHSNNMTHQDMCYELMYKAIKTYYLMLPTNKDLAYTVNYIKRAVHNHAMNIIAKFKFIKRDRLQGVLGLDGEYRFVLQTVSANQFRPTVNTSSELEDLSEFYVDGQFTDQQYDEIDRSSTFSSVISLYTSKKKRLLELISGEYDAEFTAFLSKQRRYRKADNVELYDTNIDEYKNQACRFLSIERKACDKFLQHVYKKHM